MWSDWSSNTSFYPVLCGRCFDRGQITHLGYFKSECHEMICEQCAKEMSVDCKTVCLRDFENHEKVIRRTASARRNRQGSLFRVD